MCVYLHCYLVHVQVADQLLQLVIIQLSTMIDSAAREECDVLISRYFQLGLSSREIWNKLLVDGFALCQRTVKRHLQRMNLFRKKQFSDVDTVLDFIVEQLTQAGQMCGYKMMHLKCIRHGLTVTREVVRFILFALDRVGVEDRRKRKLQRRQYWTTGPNMVWHIDGYDKIKRYGIAIHGCIDGFSRYVVWLHAGVTNNDPKVIAGYYINAVKTVGGCPQTVRADMGTENTLVAQLQVLLADDSNQHPFVYGRSVHNQRIEAWWGILRRQNIQYWMNVFEQLCDDYYFDGSFVDKSLIQFCFMDLIQVCFVMLF